MKRTALLCTSGLMACLTLTGAAVAQTTDAPNKGGKDTTEVEAVIVTGVLGATAIERAPVSVTAVTNEQLKQQSATGAAEMLKAVPGVFVNSAFGEARSIVFSRGVSANSLEAATGYFYVSLQEDGLPIEQVTTSNFGPDYFSRPDLMLDHLEALRGGTAAITGPNAPGGIFNYISRTGKSARFTEVQGKYGLEGDGRNPYYRADFYTGGQVGERPLYFALGGFYRKSDSPRAADYTLNKGGQLRANLLWDYGAGTVQVDGKLLNDHVSFPEFLPTFGYNDPKIAAPFTNTSSVLPANAPHSFVRTDGKTDTWDPTNLVHTRARAIGVTWQHDLSDNWRFENKMRYSENKANWDTGALVFALPVTDPSVNSFLGLAGLPGTITYRNRSDGSVAAVVNSTGSVYTVASSNLANPQILKNGAILQTAYAIDVQSKDFQNQFTLHGKLGQHNLAAGFYYFNGRAFRIANDGGIGAGSLTSRPRLYDITLTTAAGATYKVTDPAGFAYYEALSRGSYYNVHQENLSLFLGDTWEITDRLTLEGGLRYESLDYDITTHTAVANANNPLTYGGADNNPLTLYDNRIPTVGPAVRALRGFDYTNYSGSVSYRVTEDLTSYIRYTKGKKAPDVSQIATINTPAAVAALFPAPQVIEQVEVGLKFKRGRVDLQAYPFYSKLSNVFDAITLIDETGTPYSPTPVFGQIKTFGVEVQANVDITDTLNLYSAITLQDPKASGFSSWSAGPTASRNDDVLTTIPPGRADNNPKLIVRATSTWKPIDQLSLFATYSYLGKRAANRFNAFDLPGFATVDMGAAYDVNATFRVQANINNVFNKAGVMSWANGGGFTNALNRQNLTKAQVDANPNGLLATLMTPSRSYFLTVTAKF